MQNGQPTDEDILDALEGRPNRATREANAAISDAFNGRKAVTETQEKTRRALEGLPPLSEAVQDQEILDSLHGRSRAEESHNRRVLAALRGEPEPEDIYTALEAWAASEDVAEAKRQYIDANVRHGVMRLQTAESMADGIAQRLSEMAAQTETDQTKIAQRVSENLLYLARNAAKTSQIATSKESKQTPATPKRIPGYRAVESTSHQGNRIISYVKE